MSGPVAIGGTADTIEIGGVVYSVHEFTEDGELEILRPCRVEGILVGAGGEGGANNTGGGGGAGRVKPFVVDLQAGVYQLAVGKGGDANRAGSNAQGEDGEDTVAFGLVAEGGGGGGRGGHGGSCTSGHQGRNGASGGGGGGTWSGSTHPCPGQALEDGGTGHSGGFGRNISTTSARTGGGGGGMGGPGESVQSINGRGGYGGDGIRLDLSGYGLDDSVWFAAGGQGGTNGSGTRQSRNGIGGMGASGAGPATDGAPNTGSGGGGSREPSHRVPGKGSDGYILLRAYPMLLVSGVIYDRKGNPCQRTVYAMSRPSDESAPVLLAHTLSDPVTGHYELGVPTDDEITRVVVSEDDDAPLLNDLVDRVIPG